MRCCDSRGHTSPEVLASWMALGIVPGGAGASVPLGRTAVFSGAWRPELGSVVVLVQMLPPHSVDTVVASGGCPGPRCLISLLLVAMLRRDDQISAFCRCCFSCVTT